MRALVLLVGVDDAAERARLLRLGFGDVLGSNTSLAEIEARALHIAARSDTLPRIRDHRSHTELTTAAAAR